MSQTTKWMNKQYRFLSLLILLACASICFFLLKKEQPPPYFNAIPIEKFTDTQIPCISTKIGSNTVSLELDSGFKGCFAFSLNTMEKISDKSFIKDYTTYGVRGKSYEVKIYSVPHVSIGKYTFHNHPAQEIAEQFNHDAVIVKVPKEEPSIEEPERSGRVGWELFRPLNLLIDIPNMKIGVSDSIQTLKKHGYADKKFIRTSLLEGKPYIGIKIESPSGPLECCLDTGATRNVLNAEEGGIISELAPVMIASADFGPLEVYSFPIKIPQAPDIILGMNFFSEHIVFIDFKKRAAYLSI